MIRITFDNHGRPFVVYRFLEFYEHEKLTIIGQNNRQSSINKD